MNLPEEETEWINIRDEMDKMRSNPDYKSAPRACLVVDRKGARIDREVVYDSHPMRFKVAPDGSLTRVCMSCANAAKTPPTSLSTVTYEVKDGILTVSEVRPDGKEVSIDLYLTSGFKQWLLENVYKEGA